MSAALSEAAIAAELQHHPAASREEAWRRAERALRLRAALLAEADRAGLAPEPETDAPVRETADESRIRRLLEREVRIADVSEADCRAEFARHRARFRTPPLFEAAHILIAADMSSEDARAPARAEAVRLATLLAARPDSFARLAREHSACPSGEEGGVLGQITARDVTPEIASMLAAMTPGTICPVPVPTRHGYHLLRLDRRDAGRDLPFEAVRDRIRDHLRQRAWLAAAHAYTTTLIDVSAKEEPAP